MDAVAVLDEVGVKVGVAVPLGVTVSVAVEVNVKVLVGAGKVSVSKAAVERAVPSESLGRKIYHDPAMAISSTTRTATHTGGLAEVWKWMGI